MKFSYIGSPAVIIAFQVARDIFTVPGAGSDETTSDLRPGKNVPLATVTRRGTENFAWLASPSRRVIIWRQAYLVVHRERESSHGHDDGRKDFGPRLG